VLDPECCPVQISTFYFNRFFLRHHCNIPVVFLVVSGPSCRQLPAQRVQKSDDGRRPGDIDQKRRVARIGGARSDVCRLGRRSLVGKRELRLRHTHGRPVRHGRRVQRRPDDGRRHRLAGFAGFAAAVGRTAGRPVQRRSHWQRLQTSRQHGFPVGSNRLRDVILLVNYYFTPFPFVCFLSPSLLHSSAIPRLTPIINKIWNKRTFVYDYQSGIISSQLVAVTDLCKDLKKKKLITLDSNNVKQFLIDKKW